MSSMKKVAIGGLVFGVFSLVGVAFAQWLANGTGNGYVRSASAAGVTTSQPAQITGELWPGTSADVTVTVVNSNDVPVTVTSITQQGGQPISSSPDACDAVSFAGDTEMSEDVAANESRTLTLVGAASMAADAPEACQANTFTIPVDINASIGTATPTSGGETGGGTGTETQMVETASSGGNWGLDYSQGLGQTLTLSGTKMITRIDALTTTFSGGPFQHTTTLTFWDPAPGGTAFATRTLPGHVYASNTWTSFVLSEPVEVPANFGVTFTMTVGSTIGLAGAADVYSGGTAYVSSYSGPWQQNPSGDLALRVFGY